MRAVAQEKNQANRRSLLNSKRQNAAVFPAKQKVHPVVHLQRTIGNQAVQRLLQAKISTPGDMYEQEADRVANQVMDVRPPVKSSQEDAVSQTEDSRPASASQSSSGEEALESGDRHFFESRFNHNFADVRVHADREANESALNLQARAYTVGNNIYFAAGEYRPGTSVGRYLLSHELTHVIQQRSMGQNSSSIIQRQPQQNAPKQTPPPKQKTLKSEGVDLADPVGSKTSQIIDTVLQRNKRLAPYIGGKFKSGVKIAEKGKFVQELSDNNFDNSFRKAHGLNKSETVPSGIKGFYNTSNSTIHLRPSATFGIALHESVHKLTAGRYFSLLPEAKKISATLFEALKEGVTAYFTDEILNDEKLPNFNDANRTAKKDVEKLVTALGAGGFDLLAKFYFKDDILSIGNQLGVSNQQYVDLNKKGAGEGAKEIFKKMNALL